MPWGLKRYYGTGGLHFITWSCYRRRPLLDTEPTRDLLLNVLEVMRERYRFGVVGYSEPQIGDPSTVVQAVKRIPVVGNGDVTTPQAAKVMFEQTGCAAVGGSRWRSPR